MSGRAVSVASTLAVAAGFVAASAGAEWALGAVTDHEVKLAASVRAKVNEKRSTSLTIMARPGFVISRDGPVTVEVAPASATSEAGLTVSKRRYQRRDAADPRAESPRFDLRFTAVAVGTHELSVTSRFWVCDAHACRPVSDRRSVQIVVE